MEFARILLAPPEKERVPLTGFRFPTHLSGEKPYEKESFKPIWYYSSLREINLSISVLDPYNPPTTPVIEGYFSK